MFQMPIQFEFTRPLKTPKTPFGQCDKCHYVSKELVSQRICPICQANYQQGYTIWPDPALEELWNNMVAMWNQQRVELAAVIAAMYFESSVFHLIFWGTVWLDPDLNWIGAEFSELPDKQKRIWTYLNSICSHKKTKQALKRVFGCQGQKMLVRVLGKDDAESFWREYRKLADYRNDIVHKGRISAIRITNQTSVISDPNSGAILNWCLKFVPNCWNVFAKLHNEFIHKPMWERKQRELSNA